MSSSLPPPPPCDAVEDNIEENVGTGSASSTDLGSNVTSDIDLLDDLEQVYQSKL